MTARGLALVTLAGCAVGVEPGAECLRLSEVSTSAGAFFDAEGQALEVPGDTGFRPDWFEVCNPSAFDLDPRGYEVRSHDDDNPSRPLRGSSP